LVAPGKYLLTINPNGCHNNQEIQYGRMFYPGVANKDDARIITVGENEEVVLKKFKLLPPLQDRWFSGVVISPDGAPAAGATVFMRQKGVPLPQCLGLNSEVKTDSTGRFRIRGYHPYTYVIRAYVETGSDTPRKRLLSEGAEIRPESPQDGIRLSLEPEN
jgi:hypothetical protein